MNIIISNVVEVCNYTKEIFEYCKQELTFTNPEYVKKQRMGFWLGKTPKTIRLYEFYEDSLILPLGTLSDIMQMYPDNSLYTDFGVERKVNIKSNIKLRDYQEPCVKAVKKYMNGLIIMPVGTGKTSVALHCAYGVQQKTLWITHTMDLLTQSKERCEDNMECRTSTITNGKCDTSGDIVFATVQTLVKFVEEQKIKQDTFGMIIVDEVQHLGTSTETIGMFQQCFNYFAAKYKIGLTGTLHRADGLQVCIPKIVGDIIYEMKREGQHLIGYYEGNEVIRVESNKFQTPARVKIISTNYSIIGKDNIYDKNGMVIVYSKLLNDICGDVERNNLILKVFKELKGSTVIISDRLNQLEYLQNRIPNSAILRGSTKKSDREDILNKVRSGEITTILSTYALMAEGVDAPILENIILASPVKDSRLVIQSVGRCQRPYEGKTVATVYDIKDNVSSFVKHARERNKVYKGQGWEIIG